jgi:nitric oxide reductase subunit C
MAIDSELEKGVLMIGRLVVLVAVLSVAGAAWAEDAQELYNKKCKVCHTLNGVAGPKAKVGGVLDGIGSKRDEKWLRAYLDDPKSMIPDSKMKNMKLSKEQTDAMVNFLLAQKTK